jgi:hypothetical protein
VELAIVNLSGDLAHPHLLGLLHAYDPELEVELEVVELDDRWFDEEVVAEVLEEEPPRKRRWFDWF